SARGDVSPCVFLCPPLEQEMTWYHKNLKIRQKPLSFGNVQNMSLADIWEHPQYRQFRDTFRKRKDYHDSKLTGISCSFAGSAQLDAAVKAITQYLSKYPPPHSCTACAKLDGF
ncbi:MAG: SPASM domain-containing protein, partial [Proteobacteria bacterium]|nr:SPASM domain-containing protein [Pseudomonadota bacterium]